MAVKCVLSKSRDEACQHHAVSEVNCFLRCLFLSQPIAFILMNLVLFSVVDLIKIFKVFKLLMI